MDGIKWRIRVPIFRSTLILKQLGLAIGLPFGIIAAVITLPSGRSVYTLYALLLISLLLFLAWLFVMLVYGGKYAVEYSADRGGVRCRTHAKQAKTNRIVNGLTVTLGLFAGRPSAVGAGLLAQSRQNEYLRWSQITKVKYKPKKSFILLRGGLAENMVLFCTSENYEKVVQFVMEQAPVQTSSPVAEERAARR